MDADLERAYSPSSMVGGSAQVFIDDYVERSARALDALRAAVDTLPGGTLLVAPRQPSGVQKPTLVFIHGGYWQALSAAASMYLAPPIVATGWGFAAVEYTLAPAATISTMVGEVIAVLEEVAGRVAGPMVVAGHSAGAHLVAMSAIHRPAPPAVRRHILLSGLFDLRDLPQTSMNDALGLDVATAAALSPLLHPVPAPTAPVEVWWGERDTPRFGEMSRDYAQHLRAAGCQVRAHEWPSTHHFDIVDRLSGITAPT